MLFVSISGNIVSSKNVWVCLIPLITCYNATEKTSTSDVSSKERAEIGVDTDSKKEVGKSTQVWTVCTCVYMKDSVNNSQVFLKT